MSIRVQWRRIKFFPGGIGTHLKLIYPPKCSTYNNKCYLSIGDFELEQERRLPSLEYLLGATVHVHPTKNDIRSLHANLFFIIHSLIILP